MRREFSPCRSSRACWYFITGLALFASTPARSEGPSDRETVQAAAHRAVHYLSREVPHWHRENKCFSCHHNGDGARALFAATHSGVQIPRSVLAGTLEWLASPEQWDSNGPEGPFNDRKLARLQFAAALAAAVEAELVRDEQTLVTAAEALVQDQLDSGAWDFTGADELGSPVTYGRPLATAVAVRVLRQADPVRFSKRIAGAEAWLLAHEPKSVLNAAAVLWGLGVMKGAAAERQRERCLVLIRKGQADDGGWGPYVTAASEPFDTAVVLCALAELSGDQHGDAIRRGRDYLRNTQLSDGSWPETTRPAARESYAQRLSTTGWATIALLRSGPQSPATMPRTQTGKR